MPTPTLLDVLTQRHAHLTERPRVLVKLDLLARLVAAKHPSSRVGLAASVIDGDWGVYKDGPALVLGHDEAQLDQALVTWGAPVVYLTTSKSSKDGDRLQAGGVIECRCSPIHFRTSAEEAWREAAEVVEYIQSKTHVPVTLDDRLMVAWLDLGDPDEWGAHRLVSLQIVERETEVQA